ncbi:MAG: FAD:protein FMN transferase [Spirochaetia bacterium]|nr:FAD:protein FMN transferase [Spirochaetia bacterium]MCF7946407.1 FAD:protein FMN transferase [Spirochaetia bacterium]MCF7952515.1 FAD:protein FMN transferase [Spirochaetales bacterium]
MNGCKSEYVSHNTDKTTYKPVYSNHLALGTVCRISIYDEGISEESHIFQQAFDKLDRIEELMSLNIEESEINRINKAAGSSLVPVSDDTFSVLKEAVHISEISEASFDPTIGPVVQAWGIGSDNARIPSDDELDELLPLVDYKDIIFEKNKTHEIGLEREGMVIDVGGIAKGYAADILRDLFISEGIEGAIINLGGNIQTVGSKPGNDPWRIGIQDPASPRGDYLMVISFTSGAVVTSGTYERYFTVEGSRYHHILSTETGYPVENSIESVSILSEESFIADALSTAVFSMGLEQGISFIEEMDGIEAVFVDNKKEIHLTSGIKAEDADKDAADGEESADKGTYTYSLNNDDYSIHL